MLLFVAERYKAESKVVQNLKSSELLKDEMKETEKLRALVDHWLLAAKKLNFLSEELVRFNFFDFSQVFFASFASFLLFCVHIYSYICRALCWCSNFVCPFVYPLILVWCVILFTSST